MIAQALITTGLVLIVLGIAGLCMILIARCAWREIHEPPNRMRISQMPIWTTEAEDRERDADKQWWLVCLFLLASQAVLVLMLLRLAGVL